MKIGDVGKFISHESEHDIYEVEIKQLIFISNSQCNHETFTEHKLNDQVSSLYGMECIFRYCFTQKTT